MTTGKTTALTRWTFIDKVMSLLFILFYFFYFLTLQYCIGFAIYQDESSTGIHVFLILNPPASSLPIPSLWVGCPSAPAPSIQYRASNLDWRLVSYMILYLSLLFNMLSGLVITFLPRSKHLLILWLQSPSAVILKPQKIKSATITTVSPSISYEVMGPSAMILVF